MVKSLIRNLQSRIRSLVGRFSKLADVRVRLALVAILSAFTSVVGAMIYAAVTGQPFAVSLFHCYSVLYGKQDHICMMLSPKE
jgi:hypothetical protein